MIARRFAKFVVGAAALGMALPVGAQEVNVQASRGPHYAGDTVRVQGSLQYNFSQKHL